MASSWVWFTAAAACCMLMGAVSAFNTPVILVPGDGGNQIWATLKKANNHWYCQDTTTKPTMAWLDLINLVFPAVNCLAYNLELKIDPSTGRSRDNDGVTVEVPGFGDTETVEWLSDVKIDQTTYYLKLVEYLVKNLGYQRGVDIHGAPYDFRKAPNELGPYMSQLSDLIEQTYARNGNKPVVMVGHSMGCKITLHFLQGKSQAWKDKYIKAFVAAAGPFGGAASSMLASVSGYNLGLSFIKPIWFRNAQRSWPSTYYLFPQGLIFNVTDPVVQTKQRQYTLSDSDIRDLFQDIGYPIGYQQIQRLSKLTDPTVPPGVTTHCVFGHGLKTEHQFQWTNNKQFPDQQPDVIYSDGDGTVNIASLNVCFGWRTLQPQPVTSTPIQGAEHTKLISNTAFLQLVESVVRD